MIIARARYARALGHVLSSVLASVLILEAPAIDTVAQAAQPRRAQ